VCLSTICRAVGHLSLERRKEYSEHERRPLPGSALARSRKLRCSTEQSVVVGGRRFRRDEVVPSKTARREEPPEQRPGMGLPRGAIYCTRPSTHLPIKHPRRLKRSLRDDVHGPRDSDVARARGRGRGCVRMGMTDDRLYRRSLQERLLSGYHCSLTTAATSLHRGLDRSRAHRAPDHLDNPRYPPADFSFLLATSLEKRFNSQYCIILSFHEEH
jgi:hypothetical protein